MASTLDIQFARSQFATLSESSYIFADNAGGSQALISVADYARDYLLYNNCQPGADYPSSVVATGRVLLGTYAARVIFNANSTDEIVLGHSSTQLVANLAKAIGPSLREGDEIIITGEHEANVGPWKNLAASYTPPLPVHTWSPSSSSTTNPYAVTYGSSLPALLALITPRTRIVALGACSNVLGEMLDIKAIVKAIRARKREVSQGDAPVWICVDTVAYVPHRCIDVRQWDVEFAVFSFYKLYGPHQAAMYTRSSELASISRITHHFHTPQYDLLPYKLQPGGRGYETAYAAAPVLSYLYALSLPPSERKVIPSEELLKEKSISELREALERTSALFEAHERALTEPLLGFLTSPRMYARGVRVLGPESCKSRVPIVAFVVVDANGTQAGNISGRQIVEEVDKLGTMGYRWGHFYAYTLLANLPNFSTSRKPGPGEWTIDDGVVRISLVHYNTVEEVEKIIQALDAVLSK